MTWSEFLQFLCQPNGIAAAVGILWSVLLEYLPTFKALAPRWKRLVFMALCLIVPLLATLLGIYTAGFSPSWDETIWPALVAGVVAFGAGTLIHARKLPDAPAEL